MFEIKWCTLPSHFSGGATHTCPRPRDQCTHIAQACDRTRCDTRAASGPARATSLVERETRDRSMRAARAIYLTGVEPPHASLCQSSCVATSTTLLNPLRMSPRAAANANRTARLRARLECYEKNACMLPGWAQQPRGRTPGPFERNNTHKTYEVVPSRSSVAATGPCS